MRLLVLAFHNVIRYTKPQLSRVVVPGMVVSLPEIDRLNWHKSECEEKLAMTMAGKAAEIQIWRENVSNGPAGDIQQASGIARAMVLRWGMSKKWVMWIIPKPMKGIQEILRAFPFRIRRVD